MASYRVMSFDGGAGALTYLRCLIDLETAQPGFLEATDAFVGTSCGAWVALYLARHLGEGRSGLEVLTGCLDFITRAAPLLSPSPQDFVRFVLAGGAMTNLDGVQQLMQAPANDILGDLTLGELHPDRRVVVSSGLAISPWVQLYDSADSTQGALRLFDVGLRCGSFPLLHPVREGGVDGAVLTNNPAMVGLARVLGGLNGGPVQPGDVRLLSLGADDGSSDLSRRNDQPPQEGLVGSGQQLPGGGNPFSNNLGTMAALARDAMHDLAPVLGLLEGALPFRARAPRAPPTPGGPQAGEGAAGESQPNLPAHIAQLQRFSATLAARKRERVDPVVRELTLNGRSDLADSIRTTYDRLQSKVQAEAVELSTRQGPAGKGVPRALETRLGDTLLQDPQANWGWFQWLTFPQNFLYLMKVLLNSEARGVSEQCGALLHERFLRLAPVSLLSTTDSFLLLILGMADIIIQTGLLTDEQWFWSYHNFTPSRSDALSWLVAQWMPATAPARPAPAHEPAPSEPAMH